MLEGEAGTFMVLACVIKFDWCLVLPGCARVCLAMSGVPGSTRWYLVISFIIYSTILFYPYVPLDTST